MAENKTQPTKQSVTAFVDEQVLERLIGESVKAMRKKYKNK
jgi:hypothetical protein